MDDREFFEEFKNFTLTFLHYGEAKETTVDELYQVFRLRLLRELPLGGKN